MTVNNGNTKGSDSVSKGNSKDQSFCKKNQDSKTAPAVKSKGVDVAKMPSKVAPPAPSYAGGGGASLPKTSSGLTQKDSGIAANKNASVSKNIKTGSKILSHSDLDDDDDDMATNRRSQDDE